MPDQTVWLSRLGDTAHAVCAVDADQTIVLWNRGAEALLGLPAGRVIGRRCYDVVAGRLASGRQFCRPDCPVLRQAHKGVLLNDIDLRAVKGGRPMTVTVCSIVLRGPAEGPTILHLLHPACDLGRTADALRRFLKNVSLSLDALPSGSEAPAGGTGDTRVAGGEPPMLTEREEQVLRALAAGRVTADIAAALGVSPFTVRAHVRNLMRKTRVHTRIQLVLFAARHGLA